MQNNPPFLTSQILANATTISHGFFGRKGGVSEGIYAALNCGPGSKDSPAHVQQNRDRVRTTMGGEKLVTVYQCHTSHVAVIDKNAAPTEPCDAMVTAIPNIVLGILTADCVPVLFADTQNKIIGAAHAGWKGATTGILENTIVEMEKLDAKRERIIAAIGPCIAQASYEVGPEFVERFLNADPSNMSFFIPSTKPGHSMFDIGGYVEARLQVAGIATVDRLHRDTCAEDTEFFSYRRSCLRSEPDYGREISCIVLKN